MPKLIIQLTERMKVELEAADEKAMIMESLFWTELPHKCPICGAGYRFTHRNTKKGRYYGLACEGTPSHKTDLGKYLQKEGLFYRQRGRWKSWENGKEVIHDVASKLDRPDEEPFVMPTSHEELARQINEKWDERPRSMSIDDAIRKRFSTTLDKLPIVKKQEVLESLMRQ